MMSNILNSVKRRIYWQKSFIGQITREHKIFSIKELCKIQLEEIWFTYLNASC